MGPEVLRDVSFEIKPNSFQFLTGPSGAGKTSLLRLLFLSLRPTRGLINLFNQEVSQLAPDDIATLRRRIGIVFQDFRLLDHLTTFENVALPLRAQGRPVFVNLTADWCLTCKFNERAAIGTDAVREAMAKRGVVSLVGDWTRSDPALTAVLARFNRAGVPLYLLYAPTGEPEVLPLVLPPDGMIEAIGRNS